jgi:hypothetical protein
MSIDYVLGAIVTIGLLVYLVYAREILSRVTRSNVI